MLLRLILVNASEITYFVEDSVNGLLTGGIYALIALGIVFVFRATKVFNFAHGAIIMIGAYIFFSISFFWVYEAYIFTFYCCRTYILKKEKLKLFNYYNKARIEVFICLCHGLSTY